jgi:3-deoxy-alpha-D-manno-octulosonate 8-oxidase
MDSYIHSVEAISGTFINEFSKAFAEKSLELCRHFFLENGNDADLMVASYLGGYSIVYSEVGVCHALSYGLSYVYGLHHGEAISTVFNCLEDYYPEYVKEFKIMLEKNDIELPKNIVQGISDEAMNKMIELTYLMEKPLNNALGENWRKKLTEEKIKEIYQKI